MNWEFDDSKYPDIRKELMTLFTVVAMAVCVTLLILTCNGKFNGVPIVLTIIIMAVLLCIYIFGIHTIDNNKEIVIKNGEIIKGSRKNRKYTMNDVKTCILTTKNFSGVTKNSVSWDETKIRLLDENRKTILVTYVDPLGREPSDSNLDPSTVSEYYMEVNDIRARTSFYNYLMDMDIEIIDKRTFVTPSEEQIDKAIASLDSDGELNEEAESSSNSWFIKCWVFMQNHGDILAIIIVVLLVVSAIRAWL